MHIIKFILSDVFSPRIFKGTLYDISTYSEVMGAL